MVEKTDANNFTVTLNREWPVIEKRVLFRDNEAVVQFGNFLAAEYIELLKAGQYENAKCVTQILADLDIAYEEHKKTLADNAKNQMRLVEQMQIKNERAQREDQSPVHEHP